MKTASKTTIFTLKKNRKIKIFLFFLVLTSIIWLLVALSKNYTSIVTFKLSYDNLPSKKLLQNTPVSQLDFVIDAPGFTLLRYKIKPHKATFMLSALHKKANVYYLLPNTQISYLNKQFKGDIEVLNVLNDTIFIELGDNISKKVPIHPAVDIQFKLGYNFIEKLKITPDSIIVSGPEKYIDSIVDITTFPEKLTDVYQDINTTLKLKMPSKNSNIKLSHQTVSATGKVDKFTEGSFNLPVIIINEPEGVKVNPFPKSITVIYQVGLSNFSKVNEDSFSIVYDYNQYKNDTLTRFLTPIIAKKNEFINSVNIVPNQIEFLIQK
jgi:hypothetical protein